MNAIIPPRSNAKMGVKLPENHTSEAVASDEVAKKGIPKGWFHTKNENLPKNPKNESARSSNEPCLTIKISFIKSLISI